MQKPPKFETPAPKVEEAPAPKVEPQADTSANTSLPISESAIPDTFDETSFVDRSQFSDFFVMPDISAVDQVPYAEIVRICFPFLIQIC